MYGALLEDLKLAQERNKSSAQLNKNLQACLSESEHKLHLATIKQNLIQSRPADDSDADEEPVVSFCIVARRRVIRVRQALHSRPFRRYLLSKVQSFNASR